MNDSRSQAEIEIAARFGDRPRILPKRFQERGALLGVIEAGPRQEWRIYSLDDKVLVSRWRQDPGVQTARMVPMDVETFGFLLLEADQAGSLAGILKNV